MQQPFREEVRVPGAPDPVGPWAYVVRAGDLIFVSGFTALVERGQAVGGADAGAQARFALDKIRRCLEAAGASFADVCDVTVFYRNIADREAVNRIREEYFGSTQPASTAVEVSRLSRELRSRSSRSSHTAASHWRSVMRIQRVEGPGVRRCRTTRSSGSGLALLAPPAERWR